LKPASKFILIGTLSAFFATTTLSAGTDPVVKITSGQISGRLISSGGATFKGIPYAQPPLGASRWHEPVPVSPWKGVCAASTFGAACTQKIATWNSQEAQGNREGCLY
jgi:para-nitrobenzyl esterase